MTFQFRWNWLILSFQTAVARELPENTTIVFFFCFFNTILCGSFFLIVERNPNAWKLNPDIELISVVYSVRRLNTWYFNYAVFVIWECHCSNVCVFWSVKCSRVNAASCCWPFLVCPFLVKTNFIGSCNPFQSIANEPIVHEAAIRLKTCKWLLQVPTAYNQQTVQESRFAYKSFHSFLRLWCVLLSWCILEEAILTHTYLSSSLGDSRLCSPQQYLYMVLEGEGPRLCCHVQTSGNCNCSGHGIPFSRGTPLSWQVLVCFFASCSPKSESPNSGGVAYVELVNHTVLIQLNNHIETHAYASAHTLKHHSSNQDFKAACWLQFRFCFLDSCLENVEYIFVWRFLQLALLRIFDI